MSGLDVEKMAALWLRTVGFDKPGDDVQRLAGFARRVALACARVADTEIPALMDVDFQRPLTEELGTGYRTGRIAAGEAIRAAVRQGKGKR